jgi:putative exosortase-associated protein (TIGR04073 family)
MRHATNFLATLALAALFTAGCAGPEQKLGRGFNNTFEIVRLGELQRSVEQASIIDGPGVGYTYGVVHGLDKTFARTGVGIYEIVTSPIPSYDPIFTSYLTPKPLMPDNHPAKLPADPLFETDAYTGFSGGAAFPFLPGGGFSVFDY